MQRYNTANQPEPKTMLDEEAVALQRSELCRSSQSATFCYSWLLHLISLLKVFKGLHPCDAARCWSCTLSPGFPCWKKAACSDLQQNSHWLQASLPGQGSGPERSGGQHLEFQLIKTDHDSVSNRVPHGHHNPAVRSWAWAPLGYHLYVIALSLLPQSVQFREALG